MPLVQKLKHYLCKNTFVAAGLMPNPEVFGRESQLVPHVQPVVFDEMTKQLQGRDKRVRSFG
jgi:hypothetical protein